MSEQTLPGQPESEPVPRSPSIDIVDVAVVGAGPYGLSLAAHLDAQGIGHRVFGFPMRLWKSSMPAGMFLKSQGFASNLSDPAGSHTLKQFCQISGRPYADYGRPVSLETFVAYGEWFQRLLVPDVEWDLVESIAARGDRFQLLLSSGEVAYARKVVLAVGVEHFTRVPPQLAGLPTDRWSHPSAHRDLGVFAGKSVAVLGAGQSALESAALLRESGADVQLIARASRVAWNGPPLAPTRPLVRRLREPEAGLGSGWGTWLYSTQPRLFRHLPARTRAGRARTALGPAGAVWLRPRVEHKLPIHLGHVVDWAKADGDGVRLGLSAGGEPAEDRTVDHVLAATGYRPDVARLTMLEPWLRTRPRTLDSSPLVGTDFQSSVPGLYVTGPAVAPSFGPVMRFVYGADFAARVLSRRLAESLRAYR